MKLKLAYQFQSIFIFCFFLGFSFCRQETLTCEELNKLIEVAIDNRNFEEAFKWMGKTDHYCECLPGDQGKEYVISALQAGLYYLYMEEPDSADVYLERGLECLENDGIYTIELKARLLSAKSVLSLNMGDLPNAENYQLTVLSLLKDSLENENIQMIYCESNNVLGVIYHYQSKFNKADSVYQIALKIAEKHGKKGKILELNVLTNMAALYEDKEDYEKALPFYQRLIPLFETQPDYDREFFFNNYSVLCTKMGMYDEAIKFQNKSLLLAEKTKTRKSNSFCIGLLNLAIIYENNNQKHLVDSIYQFLPELTLSTVGNDHQLYAHVLSNYAVFAYNQDKYDLADSLIQQAIFFYKKHSELNKEYGMAISTQAGIYGELGKIHKADSLFKVSFDMLSQKIEKNSYFYITTLSEFAGMYFKIGQFEEARPYFEEVDSYLHENIRQQFLILSELRQEILFKRFERYFWLLGSYSLKAEKTIPSVSSLMFNDILLLKQFRMENGKILRRVMTKESGNNLAKKYNDWLDTRRVFAREAGLSKEFRYFDIDSLQTILENLESELSLNNTFQDVQKVIDWRDVKLNLKTNEAAIEFYHFKYKNSVFTDSVFYCALLLRPGYDHPKLIFLFEEKQLENELNQNVFSSENYVAIVYRRPNLYQLIWQPLDSLLKGVNKVYYSPSGLLHKVSFAAMPQRSGGPPLIDQYNLQYVSSTRELVVGKEKKIGKDMQSALVYGGIRYETDSLKMVKALSKTEEDFKHWSEDAIALRKTGISWTDSIWTGLIASLVRGSDEHSDPQYLKGSLDEMIEATRIFDLKGITSISLSEYEASEESFKLLGKNFPSPDIIHISTHGFFLPDPVRKKEDVDKSGSFADNPLFRSGLHFAGSINAWQKKAPLKGLDDGILYAYEIAGLDLSNTKLVVLSACETGLGDIVGSEGVYGLQRAFKLAGVEHIIMSLWKISDDATVAFMESFYRHWLSDEGMDIRTAFSLTQKEMRKKYKDPYYWAAFVLI